MQTTEKKTLKGLTVEEFNKLNKKDKAAYLKELRDFFGGQPIKLTLWANESVKEWWETMVKSDVPGKISVEMLMSEFFIGMLRVAHNEGREAFTFKAMAAIGILHNQIRIVPGDEQGPYACVDCMHEEDDGHETVH